MNKYQSGKIFKLTCDEMGDSVYIGSTTKKSIRSSVRSCRTGIMAEMRAFVWKVELLELYPCNSKKELLMRKRHWMENEPKAVNVVVPYRTIKQWNADHKESMQDARRV
jgi:hypothetical protein